jgi:hypothetical protein
MAVSPSPGTAQPARSQSILRGLAWGFVFGIGLPMSVGCLAHVARVEVWNLGTSRTGILLLWQEIWVIPVYLLYVRPSIRNALVEMSRRWRDGRSVQYLATSMVAAGLAAVTGYPIVNYFWQGPQ